MNIGWRQPSSLGHNHLVMYCWVVLVTWYRPVYKATESWPLFTQRAQERPPKLKDILVIWRLKYDWAEISVLIIESEGDRNFGSCLLKRDRVPRYLRLRMNNMFEPVHTDPNMSEHLQMGSFLCGVYIYELTRNDLGGLDDCGWKRRYGMNNLNMSHWNVRIKSVWSLLNNDHIDGWTSFNHMI